MKKFKATLVMVINMIIALGLLSQLQLSAHQSTLGDSAALSLNLFTIVASLTDITYVNYLLWKHFTK